MAAMERKVVPFYMHTGHGLRYLMDGIVQFFGYRTYFNPAPKITCMTLRTLLWIDLDYLHLLLLKS
jgi:hypothetical protein